MATFANATNGGPTFIRSFKPSNITTYTVPAGRFAIARVSVIAFLSGSSIPPWTEYLDAGDQLQIREPSVFYNVTIVEYRKP